MDNIKRMIKALVNQFFLITVCVMFFTSVVDLFCGYGIKYDSSYPWILMLTGFLGALPSLVFIFNKEPTKKQFIIRCVIHYLLLCAVITGEGFLLDWFDNTAGIFILLGELTVAYALVWLAMYFSSLSIKIGVNKALQEFNADEE
ncbi:MAG: DUF3021 family protein [Oscillospiraceae bacterium]|nr:DUF3021 family protein [Oscillospiraceae bacterium]